MAGLVVLSVTMTRARVLKGGNKTHVCTNTIFTGQQHHLCGKSESIFMQRHACQTKL